MRKLLRLTTPLFNAMFLNGAIGAFVKAAELSVSDWVIAMVNFLNRRMHRDVATLNTARWPWAVTLQGVVIGIIFLSIGLFLLGAVYNVHRPRESSIGAKPV